MSNERDKDIKSLVASLRQLANHKHIDVSIAGEAADLIMELYHYKLHSPRPLTYVDMKVGTPYRVTKPSDDGSFQVGEAIRKLANGSVVKQQSEGWLEDDRLTDTTNGMWCEVDSARIQMNRNKLLQRAAELDADC